MNDSTLLLALVIACVCYLYFFIIRTAAPHSLPVSFVGHRRRCKGERNAEAAAAPASVGCSSSFSSASASGTAANGCLRALPRPRLAGGASGTAAELVACCERLLRVVRPLLAVPPPLVPDDDDNNNNNTTHTTQNTKHKKTKGETLRKQRGKTGERGGRHPIVYLCRSSGV